MKTLKTADLKLVSGGVCNSPFVLSISVPDIMMLQLMSVSSQMLSGHMPERDFFQVMSSMTEQPGSSAPSLHLSSLEFPVQDNCCSMP